LPVEAVEIPVLSEIISGTWRLDDRDVRAAAEHAEAVLNQRTAMLASLRAR
jgi:hypothetical protein